jgi:IclR family pca regulon transcriptional regulator
MGRVMMADLSEEEVDEILASSDLEPLTEKTLTDPMRIKAELQKAKSQGWYLLDEELELGIRAVAAPVFNESGRVTAAVNVSTTVARTSVQEIHENIVPALLSTVTEISTALRSR